MSRSFAHNERVAKLDLRPIFAQVDSPFMHQDLRCTKEQNHKLDEALDNRILADVRGVVTDPASGPVARDYP
ncbi:hypothetical protein, partial [Pseudomonas aeruginosa]|uniref:hypothetical protein n=1 Tax=Pseudomonas aeruginosa TaxID=287 RepID=UPI0018795A18